MVERTCSRSDGWPCVKAGLYAPSVSSYRARIDAMAGPHAAGCMQIIFSVNCASCLNLSRVTRDGLIYLISNAIWRNGAHGSLDPTSRLFHSRDHIYEWILASRQADRVATDKAPARITIALIVEATRRDGHLGARRKMMSRAVGVNSARGSPYLTLKMVSLERGGGSCTSGVLE